MTFLRQIFISLLFGLGHLAVSQSFTKPSELKQFKITVNHDDYTVKTEILASPKAIVVENDKTYLWYASQKIMETKGGYDGKLLHGKYTSYYLNNQLKEQGVIKYGLKNKVWKYWYPDGKLREIITWKNGVKNGQYYLYNDLGQLMAKGCFKNDKLHGKFFTYGAGGKITDKKKYKNGDEVIKATKPQKTPKEKTKKTKEPKTKKNSENNEQGTDSGKEKKPSKEKKPLFKKKKKNLDNTTVETTA